MIYRIFFVYYVKSCVFIDERNEKKPYIQVYVQWQSANMGNHDSA